jgi:hypothetical protein
MTRFIRLWLAVFFSYVLIKFLFNLAVFGWIDLRDVALLELVVLPLGQAVVFWFITRRVRHAEPVASGPS